MKKINALLCAVAMVCTLALTACSDESDKIIGRWKCIRAEGSTYPMTENVDAVYYNYTDGGKIRMYDGNSVSDVDVYSVEDGVLIIGKGKAALKSKIEVITPKAMRIRHLDAMMPAVVDYVRVD